MMYIFTVKLSSLRHLSVFIHFEDKGIIEV